MGNNYIKIDLSDKYFEDLEGNKLPVLLSDKLSEVIAMATIGEPKKMVDIAINIKNKKEVDVSENDILIIIDIVKRSMSLSNLAKCRILEEISTSYSIQSIGINNNITVEDKVG